MPNYARRQQYRRLVHAGEATLGSVIAALLGLAILSAGATALAGLLLVTAIGLGLYARHWLSLASRSRVGARSEDEVQRALAPFRAEGWRLRHSLPWQGHGDIDSVAIAPTGIAIAIETKCAARRPDASPARRTAQIVACYERFGPDEPWGFADPGGWKCSARYCGAWGSCPGGAGL
jgi:hypothetical protein